jgi:aryl-alcohol dehydrogenase-like predicted oxidoreductase
MGTPLTIHQPSYSMLNRWIEPDLLDAIGELGVGCIAFSPLAQGMLTSKYLGGIPEGSRASRDSYVLATKVHGAMSKTDRGLSREQIHKQIDASLRRLRTDFVDLYQCHRYDPDTPLEETMGALTEVVRAGKARWLGFSEWTPDQIRAALALPDVERFVSSQPEYSLLQRRIEAEVVPLCEAEGISQVVWSPLAQGALTGKYRPGEAPPADSRAASSSMGGFVGRFLRDDVLEAVQRLGAVAAGIGVTTAQLALAWVLRQPNVASAIVGASRPEQVEQNAAASGVELDEATLEEIELVFAGLAGSRA